MLVSNKSIDNTKYNIVNFNSTNVQYNIGHNVSKNPIKEKMNKARHNSVKVCICCITKYKIY